MFGFLPFDVHEVSVPTASTDPMSLIAHDDKLHVGIPVVEDELNAIFHEERNI